MATNHGGPSLELGGKRVVLLLQGGGALGAYQVGAYRALAQACQRANTKVGWVGGISIGAINAAVIAGPKSGSALTELHALWDEILSPAFPPFDWTGVWAQLPPFVRDGWLSSLVPKYADFLFAAFNPLGQRHFFGSRVLDPLRNPWFLQWTRPLAPHQLAFYDTGPLRRTLDAHVDWDAIDSENGTRLSLGVTRVGTGEFVFFNSFASTNPNWGRRVLRADHVLASGALPPAFAPISIDGAWYWDGGVSSDTPIAELAEDLTADATTDTLVFLINLWDREGAIPRSFDDVFWRQKSIAYGSRKDAAVAVVNMHELEVESQHAAPVRLEVCQVMLEQPPGETRPQFSYADADFSRTTYEHLRQLGYADMQQAIEHPYQVPGVGGEFAVLYRHGTYGKHRATDGSYLALRERKQLRQQLAANSDNLTHA